MIPFRPLHLAFLLPALFSFGACDATEVLDTPPEPAETGLVTFQVRFADFLDEDRPRIAVAPFDQPTNHRFIGGKEHALRSIFSPDQSNLLFAVLDSTTDFQKFLRYDVRLDTIYAMPGLRMGGFTPEQFAFKIESKSLTWNRAGTGFYFDDRFGVTNTLTTYYYGLGDSTAAFLREQAAPVAYIGPDTLLVTARGPTTEWIVAYCLLNLKTGQLTPLNNPHLDPYNHPRTQTLDWNAEDRLFVASRLEPEGGALRSAHLILTDLDGSFFQVLTPLGPHRDIDPRWGPNGLVLFNRTPRDARLEYLCGSILLVEIETGVVREWLRPEAVEGAVHLCQPDS